MYYAKVNWFDSLKEEDIIEFIIISAKDWNDAMQKITDEFTEINSIEMIEISNVERSIIYVPESSIEFILNENGY